MTAPCEDALAGAAICISSSAGTATCPPSIRPSKKFIAGLPMNPRDEAVVRIVVEIERFAHPARPDPRAATTILSGQRHRFDLVVGDVDHRGADFLVQAGDLDPHLHAQFGIEVRQGLVEQEHLGTAHDGPPDGHPLALTAR